MPRVELDASYVDSAFEPDPAAVVATQTALGVGPDTAAVLTRRDALKAQAAAYRARTTTAPDPDVADLLDAIIAAVFDA